MVAVEHSGPKWPAPPLLALGSWFHNASSDMDMGKKINFSHAHT